MNHLKTDEIKIETGTVVALGNFDGLHNGHMQLINTVIEKKNQLGLKGVLFSFFPHPAKVLCGNLAKTIFTHKEKLHVIKSIGLDYFIEYPFTQEFANLDGYDFVKNILYEKLNAKVVVIGEGYHFGKNQSGNAMQLTKIGGIFGIEVIVLPLYLQDGIKISSSAIRSLISDGKIEEANKLLGRQYFINGKAEQGKLYGKHITHSTFSVYPASDKLLPPNGVYITKTVIFPETSYVGVTNIGHNPVFGYEPMRAQTYIKGLAQAVIGQTIEIHFEKMIRKERKFATLQDFFQRFDEDINELDQYLNSKKPE